ncbi:hypothetical protein JOF37_002800 [Microbacterium imperiale]|nr:hypothetical protein [Microbacterium imperiale]
MDGGQRAIASKAANYGRKSGYLSSGVNERVTVTGRWSISPGSRKTCVVAPISALHVSFGDSTKSTRRSAAPTTSSEVATGGQALLPIVTTPNSSSLSHPTAGVPFNRSSSGPVHVSGTPRTTLSATDAGPADSAAHPLTTAMSMKQENALTIRCPFITRMVAIQGRLARCVEQGKCSTILMHSTSRPQILPPARHRRSTGQWARTAHPSTVETGPGTAGRHPSIGAGTAPARRWGGVCEEEEDGTPHWGIGMPSTRRPAAWGVGRGATGARNSQPLSAYAAAPAPANHGDTD